MPRAREDWTGIHKHGVGWRAVVSLGPDGVRRQFFPRDTPVAKMQKWREMERAKWVTAPRRGTVGTFRNDAARYLKHPDVVKKPTYAEIPAQLERWIAELGDTPRDEITSHQLRKIRDRWAMEPRSLTDPRPLSAGRVNRLVSRLSHLWTVLDGRRAPNPVRDIEPLTEEQGPVRDIPRDDLAKLIAAMSTKGQPLRGRVVPLNASKSRARIMVLATTGLPSGTLKRLRPEDVDLKKRMIYRPERKKGAGTSRSAQPMTKAAVDAFQEFGRLNCWGPFSNSSLRKSLLTAAKNAGIKPPRIYDIRHTFLSDLARASKDEVAVMHIAQHSSINTTRRYTRGSMSDRAKAAVQAYEDATNVRALAEKRPLKGWRKYVQ